MAIICAEKPVIYMSCRREIMENDAAFSAVKADFDASAKKS
jgi:hypothetical protein